MAKKRTKQDKLQRNIERLEKKGEQTLDKTQRKPAREDWVVRKATQEPTRR